MINLIIRQIIHKTDRFFYEILKKPLSLPFWSKYNNYNGFVESIKWFQVRRSDSRRTILKSPHLQYKFIPYKYFWQLGTYLAHVLREK